MRADENMRRCDKELKDTVGQARATPVERYNMVRAHDEMRREQNNRNSIGSVTARRKRRVDAVEKDLKTLEVENSREA